jgi:glutamate dehydrogenase
VRHIIESIVERLNEHLPAGERELAARFAQQYYLRSTVEDLQASTLDNLYGAVLSLWKLAIQRLSGEPLICIYNPGFDEHGWQSSHTVVEIITDDMPFLVDSLSMALGQAGLAIHLVVHPMVTVVRGEGGHLRNVLSHNDVVDGAICEAVLHFEIDRQNEPGQLSALHDQLEHVLADVRTVVDDWRAMRTHLHEVVQAIETTTIPVADEEKAESIAFLNWLDTNHFTFIGFRAYDLVKKKGEDHLKRVPESGLGILRDHNLARVSRSFAHVPPSLRAMARQPSLLVITKSTAVSTVHRPVHLDYIGIKRYDDAGTVIGEWRFLGLYSSLAYNERPINIPILRQKVDYVLTTAAYVPGSHSRKAIEHVLDTFPRDEMFQFSKTDLYDTTTGILQVMERHHLGLFMRNDPYERFVTALVYVPRERYRTELRQHIQALLMEALDGQNSEFNVQLGDSPLARVHFIIRTQPGELPDYDVAALRIAMVEAMLSWQDKLREALREQLGEFEAARLYQRFAYAFPPAYEADFNAHIAVADIERLVAITTDAPLAVHLYRPPEEGLDLLRFKVYGHDEPVVLSDVLPMLERMGLRVLEARPYEISCSDGQCYWVLDFDMNAITGNDIDVLKIKDIFQQAFTQVCSGAMENDGFNRLVLYAGLHWRQVTLLRALAKYLVQTRLPLSQVYMEDTLAHYPELAGNLIRLFEARFDPAQAENTGEREQQIIADIIAAIDQVGSLDSDRILRQFLHLIQALLRSNYYQRDEAGQPKPFLSFKLDPAQVPFLPQPLPAFEIFVYSPRVEGVHLRGGAVARGGIRWSDRREDYRTEVLGLMKAQMVKNTVIVPVGAKGGFVVKVPPADRDALAAEVLDCYCLFIRALLELTDNRIEGVIVPPAQMVRYDQDDPYLVVAADKGTATFSDSANAIAQSQGFWLNDAFASGGSSGYDHKKIGITAKGAWEAVKRHFHELGLDTQREPFTVIGIGDMSGDVFGNGMMLSEHIRLVAAFNHAHIFIDPDPDPARSFQERQRLFQLPRSSWEDYDAALISAGGGVYSRSTKRISLSEQACRVLGRSHDQVTPNELIQLILKAPVDLLWNGGIGTYVKAARETHVEVGDRANDAVRVNASDLRCQVVAEGGNLGFTQLGRVEYAQSGGRINTDFIDNSGGVDCSDHEVNIKILLGQVIANGDMTLKQRDQLLVEMTDAVTTLVLNHSYQQTQAISIAAAQSSLMLADHVRFIRLLEKAGQLKRRLEFLPDDEQLDERAKRNAGLTRPEIAIFFAYSKIDLYQALHASTISEDPYLSAELVTYFPEQIQTRFAAQMQSHPLRREIIATQITNSLVNRMGGTFVMRLQDMTGASPVEIARCYTAVREIFRVRDYWRAIEVLDSAVSATVQLQMLIETHRLMGQATTWLLRHQPQPVDIAAMIAHYQGALDLILNRLPTLLRDDGRHSLHQQCRELVKAGVPKLLAQDVVLMDFLYAGLDITDIANTSGSDVIKVAEIFFILEARLALFWLRGRIRELPRQDLWQRKARTGLLDELQAVTAEVTRQVLISTGTIRSVTKKVDDWMVRQEVKIKHCRNLINEIQGSQVVDLAMLTVAVREVKTLTLSQEQKPA